MLYTVLGFIALFGILVMVHEWGHYYAARRLGIHATHFSLGFGPALWSRVDRHGTRWQLALLPLGGYVRFLGDKNGSSAAPDSGLAAAAAAMPASERKRHLHLRGPGARAVVIFAGPFVNLVLGLVIITGVYGFLGRPVTPPVVASLSAGGPAEVAGIRVGDRIVSVNGNAASSFTDVQNEVSLYPGQDVRVVVSRDGAETPLTVRPDRATITAYGAEQTVGRIGIGSGPTDLVRLGPVDATGAALADIYNMSKMTYVAVGQIVTGTRPMTDMGGPVKIAQMSGNAMQAGAVSFLVMLAVFSVNLALFNLLPIPVLDGGGLVVCAIEAVTRRPVSPRGLQLAQNAGALALVALMVVVTANDLNLLGLLRDLIG